MDVVGCPQVYHFDTVPFGQLFVAKIGNENQYCLRAHWMEESDIAPFVVMLWPSNADYNNKPGLISTTALLPPHIALIPNAVIAPSSKCKSVDLGPAIKPGMLIIGSGTTYLCFASTSTSRKSFVDVASGGAVNNLPEAAPRIAITEWSIEIPTLANHVALASVK